MGLSFQGPRGGSFLPSGARNLVPGAALVKVFFFDFDFGLLSEPELETWLAIFMKEG
jgi:hypothetical protein